MDEPRVAGKNRRHRPDAFLEPLAPEILDEGRGKRPHADRQGHRVRLRRRRAAHPGRAGRRGVPRRLSIVLFPLGRKWQFQNHRAAIAKAGGDLQKEKLKPLGYDSCFNAQRLISDSFNLQ